MRRQGVVRSAAGVVPFGHLGWGYHDRTEFAARVGEYLAGGMAANQRIQYVGDGSRETLCAALADIGFSEGLRSGRIRVTPAEDTYEFRPGSDAVDADATVTEQVAATEQALADGYSGLRMVNDVVEVVRTPEQRNAWAHFECLIDQKMAVLPLSALCTYDLTDLGPAARDCLCLHPLTSEETVAFRLFAESGANFAMAGEIDAADNNAFLTALQRVWRLQPPGPLVIEARSLVFITHRQLRAVDDLARADCRDVVLRTEHAVVARLAELLNMTNVQVEAVPAALASWQNCGI
ncbi:MAG: MEDS domain-containing protein [Mycobacterium sp.]|uniref:MEDS domain-containing protein n=1 Tax=Mycobacterium sp. TaxID=1785 RepID=UPI003CC5CFA4